MQIVAQFDPTAQTSGSFNSQSYSGCKIVIMNESRANLIFNFSNGQNSYVPANDKRAYVLSGIMSMPDPNISWKQDGLLTNGQAINQVTVETFQPDEQLPEQYPSPVIRQTNIVGTLIASLVELFQPNNTAVLIAGQSTIADPQVAIDSGGFGEFGGATNGDADGKIQINQASPQVINAQGVGSSGTCTIFEPLGTVANTIGPVSPFKLTIMKFSNWINKTVQTIAIDDYTQGALIFGVGNGPFSLTFNGGAAISTNMFSAFNPGTGGSTTAETVVQTHEIGDIEGQFNQIQFQTNNVAHSGWLALVGW